MVLATAVSGVEVLTVFVLEQAVLLFAHATLLAVHAFSVVFATVAAVAEPFSAVLVQAVFLAQQEGVVCACRLVAVKPRQRKRANTKERFFIGKYF